MLEMSEMFDVKQCRYSGIGGSEVWNKECRNAWALFAANALATTRTDPQSPAERADTLLREYVKRFAGND